MNSTIGELKLEIPEDRPETIMSRTFNAPRDLVFKAHSSCEHISNWWGPRSTSFVSCKMDFVEGGAWRFVLRDSDGNEAPFKGEFREIQPPERLTWTFIYDVAPFNEHEAVETVVSPRMTARRPSLSHRSIPRSRFVTQSSPPEWPTEPPRPGTVLRSTPQP